MKRSLIIVPTFLFLFSCNKNIDQDSNYNSVLKNVRSSLSDSLSKNDCEALDFSKSLLSSVDSVQLHLLRIPFKGKSIQEKFVLLQLNEENKIIKGRLINISQAADNNINTGKPFNGNITISWLNGSTLIKSPINNGYIAAFHPSSQNLRSLVVPYEGHVVGEVVVVSYVDNESSISYSFWMNLLSLFAPSSGTIDSGYGGYYNSLDGSSGGGGASYGGGGGSRGSEELQVVPVEDPPIYIDFEPVEKRDAIDIEKYLKCFSNIPDAGSTCSIEILSDIPVDNQPDKFFDWTTGSPGHTFLHLKKANGEQVASQYIGFYPSTEWKTIVYTPVEGKFADNSNHEFNASLKRDVNPSQLQVAINKIQDLSKTVKYDVDDYNCTDFSLDVFNSVPNVNPLVIPKFSIPLGGFQHTTSTPQGVYIKLKAMKEAGVEGANINIPTSKVYVDQGTGACF
jgi:uncharacterized membrane protein YgcG